MTERTFIPLPGVSFSKAESDDYLENLEQLIEAGQVEAMVNIAIVKGPAPGASYIRTWVDGITLGQTQRVLQIALDSAKAVAPPKGGAG